MKRSEMIKFIELELAEIVENSVDLKYSLPEYISKRAAGMLDMIEGFGMSPPEEDFNVLMDNTKANWDTE
jgi:hypothetical protein